MSNPAFPTMNKEQDSRYYEVTPEDKSLKTQMEGGYVVSRARHTRKPRRSFKTGYTGIGPADRQRLLDFYDTVNGSVIFDWIDPIERAVYQVRFAGAPTFKYVGIGETKLWDVQLELQQA